MDFLKLNQDGLHVWQVAEMLQNNLKIMKASSKKERFFIVKTIVEKILLNYSFQQLLEVRQEAEKLNEGLITDEKLKKYPEVVKDAIYMALGFACMKKQFGKPEAIEALLEKDDPEVAWIEARILECKEKIDLQDSIETPSKLEKKELQEGFWIQEPQYHGSFEGENGPQSLSLAGEEINLEVAKKFYESSIESIMSELKCSRADAEIRLKTESMNLVDEIASLEKIVKQKKKP